MNTIEATPTNNYSASLTIDGVYVSVSSMSLTGYLAMLARLGVSVTENKMPVGEDKPAKVEAPKPGKPKVEKAAPPPGDSSTGTRPAAQSSAEAADEPLPAKTQADAPAVTDEQPTTTIDYADLRQAVMKLVGRDTEIAGEVVKSFGVPSFKTLDPSRWAEALAAVNAKLAELGVK